MQITSKVKRDLRQWACELQRDDHEGVPLACMAGIPPAGEAGSIAVYADASGEIGWAAWTVTDGNLLWCGGEWSTTAREELHINEKELYASVAGIMTLAEASGATAVHSFTDSMVAMGSMRNMTAQSARMQELLAVRATWTLASGVHEAAHRVTSKRNLWADMASRGRAAEMMQQATSLGLRCQRLQLQSSVPDVDSLLPLTEGTC